MHEGLYRVTVLVDIPLVVCYLLMLSLPTFYPLFTEQTGVLYRGSSLVLLRSPLVVTSFLCIAIVSMSLAFNSATLSIRLLEVVARF